MSATTVLSFALLVPYINFVQLKSQSYFCLYSDITTDALEISASSYFMGYPCYKVTVYNITINTLMLTE